MSALIPIAAAVTGVAAHLLFFHHGERHLFPMRYVQALLLAAATIAVAQSQYGGVPLKQSSKFAASLTGYFLCGLYSSLLVYRIFFNPLNKFPGPYLARLTKFDFVIRNRNFDCYKQLLASHEKYGKFVRIGPNDLSVSHPDGVQVISGAGSKCYKAPWYSGDTPMISLHTTRERSFHDRRRRVWSPAFSDKALRGYEKRVQKYNDLLLQQIDAFSGKPINISKWFNLYSFDVMGDLGFGQSFNMLSSGETHWAINLLNEGMDPLGLGFPTWFFRTLIAIPGLTKGYHQFIGFCNKQLDHRMKEMDGKSKSETEPDITATLIDHFRQTEHQGDALHLIQGDSRLIIVAGSDTTAATLVHLFYHLAAEPALVKQLRQELDSLVPDGEFTHQKIQDAPILNGCINESLRLHPPVPSGVFRKTPAEGVDIAGTFVPGDTVIQMPMYVMGRDPKIYPQPTQFLPSRWSSDPHLILDHNAFVPFSTGPFGCIGKNLAYMEIRLVTAQLVRRFDLTLAKGEDGTALCERSRDHFTIGLGDCWVEFVKR